MEIWKDVVGYEGIYQVSNLGKVKSLDRVYNGRNLKSKVLKLTLNIYGYLRFTARKENTIKTLFVHRLVLEAFNPILEKLQVNHIDGIKTNNKLENLEWVSDSENKKHAYKTGLMIGGNENSKIRKDLPRYKLKSTNFN